MLCMLLQVLYKKHINTVAEELLRTICVSELQNLYKLLILFFTQYVIKKSYFERFFKFVENVFKMFTKH